MHTGRIDQRQVVHRQNALAADHRRLADQRHGLGVSIVFRRQIVGDPIDAPPAFFHPPELDPLQYVFEMDAQGINLLCRYQAIVGNGYFAKLVIFRHKPNHYLTRESIG